MGADFNVRPVGAPVATPMLRPAPEAVREAVPTQLPPDKSVGAADALLRPTISASNYQQVDSDRISREVIIDKDAAEIVYVSIDKKSNQVINQFPEQSRLRTRAYLRAMDSAKLEERRVATDRTI
ncbi:MAG: hypothetical protein JWR89_908 [Tardiphaga sp.]|jgi:hypothetical protein|uniref:hypothetical protein n=1 Tax=Tardiphaga sp. TaxID=1926292 RepID=UPI00262DD9C3|nr:hypothetical protein [Tardiphaga sp.]MDB5501006.1 hypothetical protein [Tardiphaga sp.]